MDKNYEIELCAVPKKEMFSNEVREYYILYRIKPSQLGWFRRKFRNDWHTIAHCIWDAIFPLTIKNGIDLYKYKKFIHTISDIKDYEDGQYCQANSLRRKLEKENKERNKIYY